MSHEQRRSVDLPRRGRWRTALLALGAVLALGQCDARSEDELLCEEAVAHLTGCCPGFDPRSVSCLYEVGSGCFGGGRAPDLTIKESRCVIGAKCARILAGAICERAARGHVFEDPSVCP